MEPEVRPPHVVRIRNTFLDIQDEGPSADSPPRRSSTAPPQSSEHARLLEDELEQALRERSSSLTLAWNADRIEAHSLSLPSLVRRVSSLSTVEPPPSEEDPQPGRGRWEASASSEQLRAPPAQRPRSQPATPQPQTMSSRRLAGSGLFEFDWFVDARKLWSNDRTVVSPAFELPLWGEQPTTFKIMLCALCRGGGRGGISFKRSSGRGVVRLKCEDEIPERAADVSFTVSIGGPGGPLASPPRGPFVHNFARCAVGGLPEDQAEWEFSPAIDEASQTLLVRVAAAPSLQDRVSSWGRSTSSAM